MLSFRVAQVSFVLRNGARFPMQNIRGKSYKAGYPGKANSSGATVPLESYVNVQIKRVEDKVDALTRQVGELKADMVGLKTELKADMVGLRTELKADMVGLRTELKADM